MEVVFNWENLDKNKIRFSGKYGDLILVLLYFM